MTLPLQFFSFYYILFILYFNTFTRICDSLDFLNLRLSRLHITDLRISRSRIFLLPAKFYQITKFSFGFFSNLATFEPAPCSANLQLWNLQCFPQALDSPTLLLNPRCGLRPEWNLKITVLSLCYGKFIIAIIPQFASHSHLALDCVPKTARNTRP